MERNPELLKGVMGMKFMRDAEQRQRSLNEKSIQEIQTVSLAAGSDEDEDFPTTYSNVSTENPRRKNFVPGDQVFPRNCLTFS